MRPVECQSSATHAEVVQSQHQSLYEDNLRLMRRVAELEAAIRDHRAQKADDRCIEDDDRLYAALGDGIKCDRRVGDKAAMLANCSRFIDHRCEGGGWPTYAELEAERDQLRARVAQLDPPRGKCGYRWHHADCDCGGVGGDR